MSKFREIFKNRNFFLLWTGQIVSEFGERLTQMALIGLVYHNNPYSAVAMAKLIVFIVIPVFLVGPVAGVYVDRWDRRYTMIISDLLRSFFVFLIPLSLIAFNKNILLVYALVFLIFSISRFFLPSKMAIIPDLVSQKHLLMANSLISTTRMIATVVGLGLAGILVNLSGPKGGFYINGCTFLFSAIMLSLVSIKGRLQIKKDLIETGHALQDALVNKNVFVQLREGFGFIFSNRQVRFSLKSLILIMAALGAMSVVTIVFIQECFGSATKEIGLFGMLIGAGLFAGSLVYGRLGHYVSKTKIMNISFIASGIVIAIFVLVAQGTRTVFLAGIPAFFLGLVASPIVITSNTMIHQAIPQEARGRVFSSVEMIIHIAFLVCMFIAAKAADLVGRNGVLVCCGLVLAVFGAAGLFEKK